MNLKGDREKAVRKKKVMGETGIKQ